MRWSALLLCGQVLAGCGDAPPTPAPAPPPAPVVAPFPDDPAAALAAVRALPDDAARRARLAAWPADRAGYRAAEATRTAVTWRFQLSLRAGEVEEAFDDYQTLRTTLGGEGRDPAGQPLDEAALHAALTHAAGRAVIERVQGADPDGAAALAALGIARRGLPADQAARLMTWAFAETFTELAGPPPLPPHDGPRVVVLADHFTLEEPTVAAVLRRWSAGGVRVDLLPIWRGEVRSGIRRVPASSEEERAAFAATADALGLAAVRNAAPDLGLGPEAAALVLDRHGRLVARLRDRLPDLQRLEAAVQRVMR